jgi:anti-anti-sigma factor
VYFFPLPVQFLDGCAVAILPEEIDLANADEVSDTLLALLNRGASGVIADMSGTRFCDAAGVRAIARAHHRAQSLGAWLRVVIVHPAVRKVFRLTGVDGMVRVCPVLRQALPPVDLALDAPEQQTPELIARVRQARSHSLAARSDTAQVLGRLAATYAEIAVTSERLAQRTRRDPELFIAMSKTARDRAVSYRELTIRGPWPDGAEAENLLRAEHKLPSVR